MAKAPTVRPGPSRQPLSCRPSDFGPLERCGSAYCRLGDAPRTFDLNTLATFDDFGARHIISTFNDVTEREASAATLHS